MKNSECGGSKRKKWSVSPTGLKSLLLLNLKGTWDRQKRTEGNLRGRMSQAMELTAQMGRTWRLMAMRPSRMRQEGLQQLSRTAAQMVLISKTLER